MEARGLSRPCNLARDARREQVHAFYHSLVSFFVRGRCARTAGLRCNSRRRRTDFARLRQFRRAGANQFIQTADRADPTEGDQRSMTPVVAILAGGAGTRLAEETEVRPKPMVEIGGKPILWHIMKHYAHYGFNDFVVALGYKGELHQALDAGLRDARRQHDGAHLRRAKSCVTTTPSPELERRPGRHRAGDPDRRAGQAPEALDRQLRPSCSPGATASRTSTCNACSPSTARTASSRP